MTERKRNWWDRNWKWFLPLVIIAPALCCGGGVASLVFGLASAMKSAPPYVASLEQVQGDTRVQAALGTPITAGSFVSGNLSTNNNSGTADFSYQVSGPNGSATVTFDAQQTNSVWTFNQLDVVIDDTGERIDLVNPPR
jgi:hypothetical protein